MVSVLGTILNEGSRPPHYHTNCSRIAAHAYDSLKRPFLDEYCPRSAKQACYGQIGLQQQVSGFHLVAVEQKTSSDRWALTIRNASKDNREQQDIYYCMVSTH